MTRALGYLSEIFTSYQGEATWVGYRQIFIRLAGCSLHCDYCDTQTARGFQPLKGYLYSTANKPKILANPITVEKSLTYIKKILKTTGPYHSIAITGGEPLEQPLFLCGLIKALKSEYPELKILLETNALDYPALIKIKKKVDFIAMDIKIPSVAKINLSLNKYAGILKALSGVKGCIKIIVSPDVLDKEIIYVAKLIKKYTPAWELILQPISKYKGKVKNTWYKLDKLTSLALKYHNKVRLIPQIHKLLGIR